MIVRVRAAWTGDAGEGRVSFEPLSGERTRVRVAMHCDVADDAVTRRMENTLQAFKRFAEKPD